MAEHSEKREKGGPRGGLVRMKKKQIADREKARQARRSSWRERGRRIRRLTTSRDGDEEEKDKGGGGLSSPRAMSQPRPGGVIEGRGAGKEGSPVSPVIARGKECFDLR